MARVHTKQGLDPEFDPWHYMATKALLVMFPLGRGLWGSEHFGGILRKRKWDRQKY